MIGKRLIFSDTHFSPVVDSKRLAYLKKLLGQVDQVIIAGDFWDGHLCTFDEFVKSGWRELFPLLLGKDAIYLYGNHDPKNLCDERVNLFSVSQADAAFLETDGLKIRVEHGHRYLRTHNPLLDWLARWKVGNFLLGYAILRLVAPYALKILGVWAVRFRDWGGTSKVRGVVESGDSETILVCGHTHRAVLDLKSRYANCGFIDFGWAQYLLIEEGEITLVDERY